MNFRFAELAGGRDWLPKSRLRAELPGLNSLFAAAFDHTNLSATCPRTYPKHLRHLRYMPSRACNIEAHRYRRGKTIVSSLPNEVASPPEVLR
jgi:hypothetical protein